MPQGFDYSKWDKLELSDDEDHHPGAKFIEEQTLRRIKRESHEVKEAERAERVAALEKKIKKAKKRIKELKSASAGDQSVDAADADAAASLRQARDDELATLRAQVETDEAALAQEERERKFNAEEMCYVSSERTLVGAACKPDHGEEQLDYETYAKKYAGDLEDMARRSFGDYGSMAEYFQERTHLLTEHSMGYMLLKCLYMEMEGDTGGMRRAAKVGYALKSIGDFADAGKKPMRDAARPFFQRITDEPRVLKEYEAAYEDYCDKLRARAVEKKREEAEAEPRSLEEVPREERLGPGGLDPVEVFESLPQEMQAAFESGSVDALRAFVNTLPMEEAKTHMRRMVDSGLWVPTPGADPGEALRDDE